MTASSETMEPTTGLDFDSGEPRGCIFGGLGALWMAAKAFEHTEEAVAVSVLLIAIGCHQFWLAHRSWKKPYVTLQGDQIIVFQCGTPKHYIALSQVQSWKRGLNSTILQMRDGLTVSISHLNFLKGKDADAFRNALAERVVSPVTA